MLMFLPTDGLGLYRSGGFSFLLRNYCVFICFRLIPFLQATNFGLFKTYSLFLESL